MNNNRFHPFKFLFVAMVLSALWFPLLKILPYFGEFIREEIITPGDAHLHPLEFIALLILCGTTLGWVFRCLIMQSRGYKTWLLSTLLLYVNVTVFLIVLSFYLSIRTQYFSDFFVLIYWGFLYSVLAAPLFIPVGYLILLVLRRVGGSHSNQGRKY